MTKLSKKEVVLKNPGNRVLLIIDYVLAAIATVVLLVMLDYRLWIKLTGCAIILIIQILLTLLSVWKHKTLFRLVHTFALTVYALFYIFALLSFYGVFDRISDKEKLQQVISGFGVWGFVIFVGLQILQVVFLPIPSIILDVIGIAMFGPFKAFLLIVTGVIIGSSIAFFLGKLFGKKLSEWIAGKEDAQKYRNIIGKKGTPALALMFLFPFFPDDLLCILAGMTSMSYGRFFLLTILTRPVAAAVVCFFGTGFIIPFHGWGLAVWLIIFVAVVVAVLLAYIYKKKISAWFKKLGKSKRTKKPAAAKAGAAKPYSLEKTLDEKSLKAIHNNRQMVRMLEAGADFKGSEIKAEFLQGKKNMSVRVKKKK